MKLSKNLLIALFIGINLILLFMLYHQSVTNARNNFSYQNSLDEIQEMDEGYIEDILKYNLEGNNLLIDGNRISNLGFQNLLLKDEKEKHKIVIYFPKFVCRDCLKSMFKLIKDNPNFKANDYLLLSNFYSLNELKLYKQEFSLEEYDLYLIEKQENLDWIKYPIVFSSNASSPVFLFNNRYSDLLNIFLNFEHRN